MANGTARVRHGLLRLNSSEGVDPSTQLSEWQPPEWVPVLSDLSGDTIEGRDGRVFRLDNLLSVLKRTEALHIDTPVDIDHATERPEGGAAVAWANAWKIEGGILWARVSWEQAGYEAVKNRTHKYISPAFTFKPDKGTDGLIDAIVSIGLVTQPNFDLPALNSVENKRPADEASTTNTENKESSMEPKAFRLALGLAENATDDEVLAKLNELKAAAQPPAPPAPPVLEPVAINAQIVDMVQKAVNSAIAPFKSQATESHEKLVERTLDGYVKAGKIQPTEVARNYFRGQCATADALKATCSYLDQLPSIVSTHSTMPSGTPEHTTGLTDSQKMVCRRLGIPEDKYIATSPEWKPFVSDKGAN